MGKLIREQCYMEIGGWAHLGERVVSCPNDLRLGGYCRMPRISDVLRERRKGQSLWRVGGLLTQAMEYWTGEHEAELWQQQLEWFVKLAYLRRTEIPLGVAQVVVQAMAEGMETIGGNPIQFQEIKGDKWIGVLPAQLYGGVLVGDSGLEIKPARHLGDPVAARITSNIRRGDNVRLRPAFSLGLRLDDIRTLVMVWELR